MMTPKQAVSLRPGIALLISDLRYHPTVLRPHRPQHITLRLSTQSKQTKVGRQKNNPNPSRHPSEQHEWNPETQREGSKILVVKSKPGVAELTHLRTRHCNYKLLEINLAVIVLVNQHCTKAPRTQNYVHRIRIVAYSRERPEEEEEA